MTRISVAASLACGLFLSLPAVPQQIHSPATQSPAPAAAQSPASPAQPSAPAAGGQRPAPQTQPAPTAGQQPQTKFVGNTTEIIVPVTVTDKDGRYVANLEAKDFRIEDEGRPQKITFFYHDSPGIRQHTVIGFLVDLSSGTLSHWDKFKDAIQQMIWSLMPYDPNYQGYLIGYSNSAEIKVDTTDNPDKLTDAVDRMKPGGGSSLYDAIYQACTNRKLVPGEPYQPRRVIIIVGDGHDNASQYTLDQVIELAQRNLVTIYGMSTLAFGASADSAADLERMARETGGRVVYPLLDPYGKTVSGYLSNPQDEGNYALHVGVGSYTSVISQAVNDAVAALEGEITTQYILRYVPDVDPSTAWKDARHIKVDVMSLPAGSVKVSARQVYYPNPPKQDQ